MAFETFEDVAEQLLHFMENGSVTLRVEAGLDSDAVIPAHSLIASARLDRRRELPWCFAGSPPP